MVLLLSKIIANLEDFRDAILSTTFTAFPPVEKANRKTEMTVKVQWRFFSMKLQSNTIQPKSSFTMEVSIYHAFPSRRRLM